MPPTIVVALLALLPTAPATAVPLVTDTPWITAQVEGSASQEGPGKIAVFPGSVVHLECVFPRKMGIPEWRWSSPLKSYLTGWAVSPEERGWKYKLSIYSAKVEDSGVFTCSTPNGMASSITLLVEDVHCNAERAQPLSPARAKFEGTRLGQAVQYSCPDGYSINGTGVVTCMANGHWSKGPPLCQSASCSDLELTVDSMVILSTKNTSIGTIVQLSCPWGHLLEGPDRLECLPTGVWSAQLPICQEVRCEEPESGDGVMIEGEGERRVGTEIRFSCVDRRRLAGHRTALCTENGLWSHPPPICVAYCEYPGEPENGRVVPLKFSYEPGDRLKVSCSPGFVSRLDAIPLCLANGSWSHPLPECTDYTQV